MGWSYGGYMTSWTITQTSRFKAASVGAGVTNLMSFQGTADIPGFLPDYFGGEFWDAEGATRFQGHSAMFHVEKVKTPTLIQHGEQDLRVPISQGYELYGALKRRQGAGEDGHVPAHAARHPGAEADAGRDEPQPGLVRRVGAEEGGRGRAVGFEPFKGQPAARRPPRGNRGCGGRAPTPRAGRLPPRSGRLP